MIAIAFEPALIGNPLRPRVNNEPIVREYPSTDAYIHVHFVFNGSSVDGLARTVQEAQFLS